jgi:hypothetical protein
MKLRSHPARFTAPLPTALALAGQWQALLVACANVRPYMLGGG